jgi:osmoprotectant transport system substrate-binding protein
MRRPLLWPLALLVLLLPLMAGCGMAGAGSKTVTIGSKNFTEQLILGEMYAQLLEANGIKVKRKLNLGSTAIAHEALRKGDIDLYPEYTGTGLLAILKMNTLSDPGEVYRVVADAYKDKWNLIWLDQAPMNNSQALAVSRQLADAKDLHTISHMTELAGQLTLVAVPDFQERRDALPGLKQIYGDFQFKDIQYVEPGNKYQVFLDRNADIVQAFGTDGQINGLNLVVLQDDKGLWPPYHVAPVVRNDTLKAQPKVTELLNGLSPLLTSDVMRNLNWQVDGPDHRQPADVARSFLQEHGLLKR